MKKTKRKTLLALLSLAVAMSVSSQETPQREQKTIVENSGIQTDAVSGELELSSEQREQLAKINREFHESAKARQQASAQERQKIYQGIDDSLKAISAQEKLDATEEIVE